MIRKPAFDADGLSEQSRFFHGALEGWLREPDITMACGRCADGAIGELIPLGRATCCRGSTKAALPACASCAWKSPRMLARYRDSKEMAWAEADPTFLEILGSRPPPRRAVGADFRGGSNAYGTKRHPQKMKHAKGELKAPHPHPRPRAGLPVSSLRSIAAWDFVVGCILR